MKTPTKLDHFIKASKNGVLTMDEELGIIKYLVTKYNFISKSEYAKKENITPQGVKSRLKANQEPHLEMIGKLFIIP